MASGKEKNKYSLWILAWPIFIEVFLQFMLGAADTLMVSKISDDAVAVVGFSNQLFNGVNNLFMAIASGAGILIAQRLGAGREKDARVISTSALHAVTGIAILLSASLAVWPLWYARLLQFPENLLPLAEIYISIVGGGMVLVAIMFTLSTAIRSTGNTKGPMLIALGMNVVHVAMNYAFIYGAFGFPKWGLTGVAWSTNISRTLAVLVLFVMFLHAFSGRLRLRELLRFDRKLFAEVFKLSWPLGVNGGSWVYSQIVIFAFIALLGAKELAARTYMNTLESFCFMLGWAFAMAVQIQVAHLYGAEQTKEAYRSAYKALLVGLGVVTVNALLVMLVGEHVLGWFTVDGDIIAMGVSLLALNLILQPGKMINMGMVSALNAIGDTRYAMITSVMVTWSVAVGLSYYFGVYLGWGLTGIYICMILDEYLRGLLVLLRWRGRKFIRRAEAEGAQPMPPAAAQPAAEA